MKPFQLSLGERNLLKFGVRKKRELAKGRDRELFSILEQIIDPEERVALEFLFAFMPFVDLADYAGELFLKHVRHSLETRRKAPWGGRISDALFLHYVLPYRISNETIEDYRPYFFTRLYHRVKEMSMKEAILEINHWCHEKATYVATDPRTASPLAVVRAARGRCGEESALLVAALRSLGIPARQVYTPLWAHTDSNHAWVEAWADGKWYYLGACEPEPRLNLGWFSGPASRAMLIHTRVPGNIYAGPEEKIQVTEDFTELNLLANYAPSKELEIVVRNRRGQPAPGARVELKVFNYGGFSTLVKLSTNSQGVVRLTTGHGDLLVHACTEQDRGSILVKKEERQVCLSLGQNFPSVWNSLMEVPVERQDLAPEVSEQERTANQLRLEKGDALRNLFKQTFVSRDEAAQIAEELDLPVPQVWAVLENAQGNSWAIAEFLRKNIPLYGPLVLQFLEVLAAKDLIYITSDTMLDQIKGSVGLREFCRGSVFVDYVLQPRITLETLRPYRLFFQREFSLKQQERFRSHPLLLQEWVEANIVLLKDEPRQGWPSPRGVYELRAGNTLAMQILFVALARSFGIPARIAPTDGVVQYLKNKHWNAIHFGSLTSRSHQPGVICLHKPQDYSGKVEYFQSFTLARLQNQAFKTLRFRGLDEETFDDESFTHELLVDPGYYRLTTGNRLSNGSVLIRQFDFTVEEGTKKDIELVVRDGKKEVADLGKLPLGLVYDRVEFGAQIIVEELRVLRGLVLIWLEPEREPTKHLVRDLEKYKDQFQTTEVPILCCLGADQITNFCGLSNGYDLPNTVIPVIDDGYSNLLLLSGLRRDFPIVVVADNSGVICYQSSGYQIGTAVQILDYLKG